MDILFLILIFFLIYAFFVLFCLPFLLAKQFRKNNEIAARISSLEAEIVGLKREYLNDAHSASQKKASVAPSAADAAQPRAEVESFSAAILAKSEAKSVSGATLAGKLARPAWSVKEPSTSASVEPLTSDMLSSNQIGRGEDLESNLTDALKPQMHQDSRSHQSIFASEGAVSKIMLWMGAFCLILGGFFLIRYSIERGLLTPLMRLMIAGGFAAALYGAAEYFLRRKESRDLYIAALLAGASFCVAYGTAYAAGNYFHFVSKEISFAMLFGVSAVCMAASRRYSGNMVLMSFLGAVLAPITLTECNLQMEYLYVYFAVISVFTIKAKNNGHVLLTGFLVLTANILFVLYVGRNFIESETPLWRYIVFNAYLAAISVIFYAIYAGRAVQFAAKNCGKLNIFNIFKSVFIFFAMLLISFERNDNAAICFVPFAILFFALSAKDAILFCFTPLVALFYLGFFYCRNYPQWLENSLILMPFACFMALIFIPSQVRLRDFWSALLSCLFAAFLVFSRPNGMIFIFDIVPNIFEVDAFYAIFFACVYAALFIIMSFRFAQGSFSEYALSVPIAAFFGFTLSYIVFQTESVYACAIPLIFLAFCVYGARKLEDMAPKLFAAAAGFSALMFYCVLRWIYFIVTPDYQSTYASLFVLCSSVVGLFAASRIYDIYPIFLKGTASFAGLSFLFGVFMTAFSILGIIKIPQFSTYWIPFVAVLAGVVALAYAGKTLFKGAALEKFPFIAALLISFLFINLPFFFLPYMSTMTGVVLFNESILVSLAPAAIWFLYARFAETRLIKLSGFIWAVGFVFLYLNAQVFYYYRAQFPNSCVSDAEIYTYSAVWLIYGVGLLAAAYFMKSAFLRYASLVFVMLAVLKAFIYDASELDGILRVASFIGLGLTLMGIGYLYAKFVFKAPQNTSE